MFEKVKRVKHYANHLSMLQIMATSLYVLNISDKTDQDSFMVPDKTDGLQRSARNSWIG